MIVPRRRGDGVASPRDRDAAARGTATDPGEPETEGAPEPACVALAEAGRQGDEQLVLFPAPRRRAGADARPTGNPLERDLGPHLRRPPPASARPTPSGATPGAAPHARARRRRGPAAPPRPPPPPPPPPRASVARHPQRHEPAEGRGSLRREIRERRHRGAPPDGAEAQPVGAEVHPFQREVDAHGERAGADRDERSVVAEIAGRRSQPGQQGAPPVELAAGTEREGTTHAVSGGSSTVSTDGPTAVGGAQ